MSVRRFREPASEVVVVDEPTAAVVHGGVGEVTSEVAAVTVPAWERLLRWDVGQANVLRAVGLLWFDLMVEDRFDLEREARGRAFADMEANVHQLAVEAGKNLGRLLVLSETPFGEESVGRDRCYGMQTAAA